MFTVDVNEVLIGIVKSHLVNSGASFMQDYFKNGNYVSKGIIVELSLKITRGAVTLRRDYYLLFCGNVSVFYTDASNEGNILKVEDIPLDAWINTSNHHTCWESDGLNFLNTTYRDMLKCFGGKRYTSSKDSAEIGFMFNHRIFPYWVNISAGSNGKRKVENLTKVADDFLSANKLPFIFDNLSQASFTSEDSVRSTMTLKEYLRSINSSKTISQQNAFYLVGILKGLCDL